MLLTNVDRILTFREDAGGLVLSIPELEGRYQISPVGTNYYYGINEANVAATLGKSSALTAQHRPFFDALLNYVKQSSADEVMLMLGVEPPETDEPETDPYAFVETHIDLVERLASDLDWYQQQADDVGKRPLIVTRYASEMNDQSQSKGRNPAAFKSTFVAVRQVFLSRAPRVLMAFSPALRADLPQDSISQYWPGDENVDIISGTWYMGSAEQRDASESHMREYFLQRLGLNKGFGLDEVGGCDATGGGNDSMLRQMLNTVESLQMQNVIFKYATLFLADKWGTDATLSFLRSKTASGDN
jgi:hypothetical protein